MHRLLAASFYLCCAFPFVAASHAGTAPAATRVELPIRAVTLSDGARRYAVTIRIAGQDIIAGLDTGSTGLRVLPRALPADSITARGPAASYSYTSGTQFDGHAIGVVVGMGDISDAVRVQRIDKVSCRRDVPDCPASHVAADAFGIQGDGLAGEGFAAILGVGLKADPVPNTLEALGATRWIVELPRPNDTGPGRLILNPDNAEIVAYRQVKLLDKDGNSVAGCIVLPPPAKAICGPARLDTGAPGLRVVDTLRHADVPQGTPAQLVVGDRSSQMSIDVAIGRRDQASKLTFEENASVRQPQLYLGIAPYFAWSVLYDPAAATLGLKPR